MFLNKSRPDYAGLLGRDLRVLDQLGQVLLTDPVLGLDVQQDDPENIANIDSGVDSSYCWMAMVVCISPL